MALVKVPKFLSVPSGGVLQSVYSENTTADVSCTTPVTGTYPNISGGDEVCNATITPSKTTSIIELIATFSIQVDASNDNIAYSWIQQDTVTPVRAYSKLRNGDTANSAYSSDSVTLRKRFVAGSTSALTFRLYAGKNAGPANCVVNPGGGEATLIINELEA